VSPVEGGPESKMTEEGMKDLEAKKDAKREVYLPRHLAPCLACV